MPRAKPRPAHRSLLPQVVAPQVVPAMVYVEARIQSQACEFIDIFEAASGNTETLCERDQLKHWRNNNALVCEMGVLFCPSSCFVMPCPCTGNLATWYLSLAHVAACIDHMTTDKSLRSQCAMHMTDTRRRGTKRRGARALLRSF
jgi:hypothetical protein